MTRITPEVLLHAYAAGVFPMAENADDPHLHWIDPEERGVMPLDRFHVSSSLRKRLRHHSFEVRINTAFEQVMAKCAERTRERKVTWINKPIQTLYGKLFDMGHCHSVECWHENSLVGGLYGVSIGAAFFGESMFSRATDASKIALVHLVARLNVGGYRLLDAQFTNDHLMQFGAIAVSRNDYRIMLKAAIEREGSFLAFDEDASRERVLAAATMKQS